MDDNSQIDKIDDIFIDSSQRDYIKYAEIMSLDYDNLKDEEIEIMALNPDPKSSRSLLENIFPGMDSSSDFATEVIREYSTCKILFDHSRKLAILLFGLGTKESPYNPVPGTPIGFFEAKIQSYAVRLRRDLCLLNITL